MSESLEHEPTDDASSAEFDAFYYAHDCGIPYARDDHWLNFFAGVADGIIREFAPARVLDVGCAWGFLVEKLRERGVEAWGIDLSDFAIGQVHESVAPYCAVSSATAELPEHFPRDFALVTCVEVIEHLPAELGQPAIDRLTSWAPRVLFSSSPHDYAEATHLNVLPPEEWAAMFARSGMLRDFDVDCTFLTPWATAYERSNLSAPYAVKRYERRYSRYHRENVDLRGSVVRLQNSLANADSVRLAAEREAEATRGDADGREQQINELKSLLANANERADHLAEVHDDLREHYDAAVRDRDALLVDVDERRASLDQLRSGYQTLAEQLDAANRRSDELRSEKQQLRSELDTTSAELQRVVSSRTWRYGAWLTQHLRLGRRG